MSKMPKSVAGKTGSSSGGNKNVPKEYREAFLKKIQISQMTFDFNDESVNSKEKIERL